MAVLALAVAVALLTLFPVGVSSASTPCGPTGHREIVLARPHVVIIHDPSGRSEDEICNRDDGKRTLLDVPVTVLSGGGRPDAVAPHSVVVSAHRVAYSWDDNEGTDGYTGISVVDARNGMQLEPAFYRRGHYSRFRRIVLSRTGGVAWSERGTVPSIRACDRSCVLDDSRGAKVVARGHKVDPDSLHGVHGGIAWRNGSRSVFMAFR